MRSVQIQIEQIPPLPSPLYIEIFSGNAGQLHISGISICQARRWGMRGRMRYGPERERLLFERFGSDWIVLQRLISHKLRIRDLGAIPRQRRLSERRGRWRGQGWVTHSPLRMMGSGRFSLSRPSTSIPGHPIMKSTWTRLLLPPALAKAASSISFPPSSVNR